MLGHILGDSRSLITIIVGIWAMGRVRAREKEFNVMEEINTKN